MIGILLTSSPTNTPQTASTAKTTAPTNGLAKKSLVENSLSATFGPADATVTVVEFIDFECPYCRASAPAVEQIMKKYEGKSVRFMFRQLPLTSIHPHALVNASVSLCAHEQGKFMAAYHALYQLTTLDDTTPTKIATEIGLDQTKFSECMTTNRYQAHITKDITDALDLGLVGTPTFFINGRKLEGTQSAETLQTIIDTALSTALQSP